MALNQPGNRPAVFASSSPMDEFLRYLQGNQGMDFKPYAAGNKQYGPNGRSAPNVGPVSNMQGYADRDNRIRAAREQKLKQMQAGQRGRYMSKDYLNEPTRESF